MRRESRTVLLALSLFHLGTGIGIAQQTTDKDAAGANGEVVRLTLDVSWGTPRIKTGDPSGGRQSNLAPTGDFTVELSAGRVIDAIAWPPDESPSAAGSPLSAEESGMGPGVNGVWRLGNKADGRARVRIEAPLDALLVIRGVQQPKVAIPLVAIVEKSQHTPPQSPLMVSVERVAWDSLAVDLLESAKDGIVEPGAAIPVSVGFNILWPEPADVSVRTTAVLRSMRGADELGRYEPNDRELVPTNRREPPIRTWSVKAPLAEGTYVLEVSATWASPGRREGSVLGRLIRRRWSAALPNSAMRRVVFTVVDPAAKLSPAARDGLGRETEADAIDLTRSRSHRPLAAGRGPVAQPGGFAWPVPAEALIEPSRRDRLLGWIRRTGTEASKLEPANASGLAWSAMSLKVAHPERPHRLVIKVRGGEPAALGVSLIEPGGGGLATSPRLLLDACASGPAVAQDGPPAAFQWLVWPSTSEMVLLLLNRSSESEVRLGMVTLTELDELPQVFPPVETHSTPGRTLGLYLAGMNALEPFGASSAPRDAVTTAQNLVKYLGYCGASAVVLPEQPADRSIRRALDGFADEDSTGPDRLDVIRRVLSRQHLALWFELDLTEPNTLPGLPRADSPEAAQRGLVRLDRQGRPDGPEYNPLHPEVREAMKRRVTEALTQSDRGPAGAVPPVAGVVIRLGAGPTLLGTPDTGFDDLTFDRFVAESFSAETARGIPGTGQTDPDRFTVRADYLAGAGRMPWLAWRSRAIASLYTELNAAAQAAAPGTVFAVVTPGLDRGPAGAEARRVDRANLAPSQAWRNVGLDLQAWPSTPAAPAVFRGVALSTDALGHDLATSPDLDSLVAGRPDRGLFLGMHDDSSSHTAPANTVQQPENLIEEDPSSSATSASSSSASARIVRANQLNPTRSANPRANNRGVWLRALPLGNGAAADEPMGHAIAALDARWVFLAHQAVSGQEERLRRFGAVLHALPPWPTTIVESQASPTPKPFGVTVRRMSDDAQTFLEFANDSPYPIRLASLLAEADSAPVEDRGRALRLSPAAEAGGRSLVLDLSSYGVAAIRIGAPRARLSSVTAYPSETAQTTMRRRFNELSAQLVRVNHGLVAGPAEPVNSGFEPDDGLPLETASGAPRAAAKGAPKTGGTFPVPRGWRLPRSDAGSSKSTIAIDRENPHTGQGSLKLTAPVASSSVISEDFAPNVQSDFDMAVFCRTAAAGSKVRVSIEGESGGRPFIRRTEQNVSTTWESLAIHVLDIPPGGLDSARVRFELRTPGILWIDDLRISAKTSSRSTRLNAQRMLLAALQAYREQRYADFARLSSSHWIRQSTPMVGSRLARTNDPPPDEASGRAKR